MLKKNQINKIRYKYNLGVGYFGIGYVLIGIFYVVIMLGVLYCVYVKSMYDV